MLESFSYGEEFLRLNFEALEAYSSCCDSSEIATIQEGFHVAAGAKKASKQERIAREESERLDNIGGYMDDMDLPPMDDSDVEYNEDEEDRGLSGSKLLWSEDFDQEEGSAPNADIWTAEVGDG